MQQTSQTISALRLPLAVMVVFLHSVGMPSDAPTSWGEVVATDAYSILCVLGSHVISHIAVPSFFLISGYLFFIKMEKPTWTFYKEQWKKRLHTLLIPYVTWNIIALFYYISIKIGGVLLKGKAWSTVADYLNENLSPDIFWSISTWGMEQSTVLGQVSEAYSGPLLVPLWFVRDLMIAVVLAPLLCWLLRKTRGTILLLLASLYVLNVQTVVHQQTITALLFFGTGAWFAIRRQGFANFAMRNMRWTLPLWVVLVAVDVYFNGSNTAMGLAFYPLMVLLGVFAFIGIIAKWGCNASIYNNSAVRFAASNTFFIYVAHGLFGLTITWLMLTKTPIPPTMQYLVAPFIAITLCLAVLWVMKRWMPKTTAMMIGEQKPASKSKE